MPESLFIPRARLFEISSDNATWWEVPGVSNVSKSGGEGSQTQITAINGVAAISEPPGVPSYAVTLASYAPQAEALKIVEAAAKSQNVVYYRFTTGANREILAATASATTGAFRAAAIATTGVVTFTAGTGTGAVIPNFLTDPQYSKLGLKITVSSTDYFVSKISGTSAATAVTVTPAPGTAVAAATYSISVPQLRETGAATVSAAGNYDGDTATSLTGGFTLQPQSRNDLLPV